MISKRSVSKSKMRSPSGANRSLPQRHWSTSVYFLLRGLPTPRRMPRARIGWGRRCMAAWGRSRNCCRSRRDSRGLGGTGICSREAGCGRFMPGGSAACGKTRRWGAKPLRALGLKMSSGKENGFTRGNRSWGEGASMSGGHILRPCGYVSRMGWWLFWRKCCGIGGWGWWPRRILLLTWLKPPRPPRPLTPRSESRFLIRGGSFLRVGSELSSVRSKHSTSWQCVVCGKISTGMALVGRKTVPEPSLLPGRHRSAKFLITIFGFVDTYTNRFTFSIFLSSFTIFLSEKQNENIINQTSDNFLDSNDFIFTHEF